MTNNNPYDPPPLPPPAWLDDFEDGDNSDWTATVGTGIGGVNQDTANSGTWSQYTGQGTYTWDSPVTDTSTIPVVGLDMWVRQGGAFGGSENPDSGEDLEVSYLNNALTWILLETLPGADAAGTIYTRTYFLPADAVHANFQVRFYQTGGSGAGFDFWHVDDVGVYDVSGVGQENCWYYGIEGLWEYDPGPNNGKLMTPFLNLPGGGSYAEMNVWHWYDFESGWDGGVVEITTDAGQSWNRLTPNDGYDGPLGTGFGNVLEGQDAFTGASGGYVYDVFDISSYIGSVVKIRFWAGVDSFTNGAEGWYVDDITVTCPGYGAMFTPPAQSSFNDPGDLVTYSETVTNIGRNPDSFDLTFVSALGWPTSITDTSWNPIANTGNLAPGGSLDLYINVSVPVAALTSDTEITTVTATSVAAPAYFGTCTLTTYVRDDILLVSDCWENFPVAYEWMSILNSTGLGYDWYSVYLNGVPTLNTLQIHNVTIWHTQGVGSTYHDTRDPLEAPDRAVVGQYLDGGGLMYLSSAAPVSAFFNGYVVGFPSTSA
jgi:hypothetical protein